MDVFIRKSTANNQLFRKVMMKNVFHDETAVLISESMIKQRETNEKLTLMTLSHKE